MSNFVNAKKVLKEFDSTTITKKYIKLYEETLRNIEKSNETTKMWQNQKNFYKYNCCKTAEVF